MKNLFIFFVSLSAYSAVFAQYPVRYNGTGNGADEIKAMVVDDAGNVYVTGYSYSAANDNDYVTIKYNSSGVQQWLARYNGPGNGSDVPAAIYVDGSGNVYVTGMSDQLTGGYINNDVATVKYNAAGAQLWVARYDGARQREDAGKAVKVDAAGNVYVTGYLTTRNAAYSDKDYLTLKYNAAGVQQWAATYNGPANRDDAAVALGLDGAGNVYVTGSSFAGADPLGEQDYLTIKYNPAGVQQWTARYNGPANEPDLATGIAVDNAGNAFITGYSTGIDLDYATIKYNTAGVQQWVARYNGPASSADIAYAIAIDAADNVYVTGGDQTTIYNSDYRTIKYNSAGVQQWTARYNGPANDNDEAYAVAVDKNGNVYVTGYVNGTSPSWDIATIKYSATGVQQWVKRFDGAGHGNDVGNAIGVDGLGNVYVGGSTTNAAGNLDYVTAKYTPTGTKADDDELQTEAPVMMAATADASIAVYPNPANSQLNIRGTGLASDHYKIIMTNTLGQVIREQELGAINNTTETVLDIQALPGGLYFLTLYSDKAIQTVKVIKN